MDSFIRRAAGRGSGDHPRSTITDGDDAFTRRAKELGVAPDLVDAARAVVPNAGDLSGAALHSALERAISDRPSLRVAESRAPGRSRWRCQRGGVPREVDENAVMNQLIRA